MRIELDALQRAYVANRLRERAAACRVKSEAARQPRIKEEWLTEARQAETLAEAFDAGEQETEPVRSSVQDRGLDLQEQMSAAATTQ